MSSPATALSTVDLPAPFGPMSAVTAPSGIGEARRLQDDAGAVGEDDVGGGDGSDLRMITKFPTVSGGENRSCYRAAGRSRRPAAAPTAASRRTRARGSWSPRTSSATWCEHLVGDAAEVEVVMPPNADPHDFAASAQQAASMRDGRRAGGQRAGVRGGAGRHHRGGGGRRRARHHGHGRHRAAAARGGTARTIRTCSPIPCGMRAGGGR